MMLDVLLRGGRLVDGSGAPWVPGDVAIQDDRIVAVGNLPGATARRIIDVPGQVIAPGFIDCHTHSDWSILANRACDSTVRLGVTTEILGNCGFSHAPLSPHNRESISTDLARSSPGTTVTWSTFGEYLDTLAAGGLGGNVSVLVGHGAVRSAVMGYDEKPATLDAIAHMERLVAQALDEGALGLSTGLEYVPGRAASAAELTAMSRIVARTGRVHACHQRTRNEEFEQSVAEIVGICEQAGARLQLSHNFARRGSPPGAWGRVMDQIDAARRRGLDVSCDTTSYATGIGVMAAVLPPWLFDEGPAVAAERLAAPAVRERVKNDCSRYWLLIAEHQWDKLWLARTANSTHLFGKSFVEIGDLLRQDPMDSYLDILRGEGAAISDAILVGEENSDPHLQEMMTHPLYAFEADSWTASATGPLAPLVNHPANFGWTARILGDYVRERGWMPLESAVHKMTAVPATKFGFTDRGVLRPGLAADIVVFDPATIQDNGTLERPAQYPSGISYVFVNGAVTVEQGEHTGARSGQVLRPAH